VDVPADQGLQTRHNGRRRVQVQCCLARGKPQAHMTNMRAFGLLKQLR
jgi:hypothetical protein